LELVITEKKSVAESIAAVLNANEHKDGYFIGDNYIVSWCVGHLLELAAPEVYDEQYKRWRYADLPIVPEKWRHIPSSGKAKQLEILCTLMNRSDVDTIINGADSGREGENIFRTIYNYAGCHKKIKRLWISSMEEMAIKAGFANLKDGAEYDNLYAAASCREHADWLVGISSTRLFSILYGDTLNVGRVQSPTLAMLVNREAEIENFISRPFYLIELNCGDFTASSERFSDNTAAENVMAGCSTAVVSGVNHTEKSIVPPKLYDLTTLQREANRIHGYTAQQTLDYAQSLYEKKYATYPRADSRHLTEDMAERVAALAQKLASGLSCDVSHIINSKKVSDHHAIIPTEESTNVDLSALPKGERLLLEMITNRLICSVGEKHRYLETIITLNASGREFKSKGKAIIHNGWKSTAKDAPVDEDEESAVLPEIAEGITLPVTAVLKEGTTSPPKSFTDGTLLTAMENAGGEDMPKSAERKGIGTPATRSGIIEKIIKAGFAERKGKDILPTKKGIDLIAVLPDALKSPALTAEWEQQLQEIQRGELDDAKFIDDIVSFMRKIVSDNKSPRLEYMSLFAGKRKPAADSIGICPRCGNAVLEGEKGFFCDNHTCKFALWKDSRFFSSKKKTITKTVAIALLTEGRIFFSDLYSARTGKI